MRERGKVVRWEHVGGLQVKKEREDSETRTPCVQPNTVIETAFHSPSLFSSPLQSKSKAPSSPQPPLFSTLLLGIPVARSLSIPLLYSLRSAFARVSSSSAACPLRLAFTCPSHTIRWHTHYSLSHLSPIPFQTSLAIQSQPLARAVPSLPHPPPAPSQAPSAVTTPSTTLVFFLLAPLNQNRPPILPVSLALQKGLQTVHLLPESAHSCVVLF